MLVALLLLLLLMLLLGSLLLSFVFVGVRVVLMLVFPHLATRCKKWCPGPLRAGTQDQAASSFHEFLGPCAQGAHWTLHHAEVPVFVFVFVLHMARLL